MANNIDTSKISIKYTAKDNSFKLSFTPSESKIYANVLRYQNELPFSYIYEYLYGSQNISQPYEIGDFNFETTINNPCPITGCANSKDKMQMQQEVAKVENFVFTSLMNYPSVQRTIVKTPDDLRSIIHYDNDNNEILRNYDVRSETDVINTLVFHYTVSDAAHSFQILTTPRGVSAHYLVYENGEIMQLVGEDKVAWHAGVSSWKAIQSVNKHSIGIEIVNKGINETTNICQPYPAAQINAVKILALDILDRYPAIVPSNVVGHSDIAPTRKIDPGQCFPWPELAASGIGIFPSVILPTENKVIFKNGYQGPEVITWKDKIKYVGYNVTDNDIFGAQEEAVAKAFHSRYLGTYPTAIWDEHGEVMLTALVNDTNDIYAGA